MKFYLVFFKPRITISSQGLCIIRFIVIFLLSETVKAFSFEQRKHRSSSFNTETLCSRHSQRIFSSSMFYCNVKTRQHLFMLPRIGELSYLIIIRIFYYIFLSMKSYVFLVINKEVRFP